MIPRILHYVWVGPYKIPKREREFMARMKEIHPDFQCWLWTDANLPALPENVRYWTTCFHKREDFAHECDVLRVFLVYHFGGIYLDVDFEPIGNLNHFPVWDQRRGLLTYHGDLDTTIPNGVLAFEREHPLAKHLVEQITPKGGWFGPSWVGNVVRAYYGHNDKTPQKVLGESLDKDGITYVSWPAFERQFPHRSLYSWSPANRERFRRGLME